MFPWVCGFSWQAGNLIFLTIFYVVVVIIVITFLTAAVRAVRDLKSNRAEEVRWHVDFGDLPDSIKICRHVFTGETNVRFCRNAFDCRGCKLHAQLAVHHGTGDTGKSADTLFGLHMPHNLLYHRGHTWVRKEADGTLSVGLDEFGKRLIGHAVIPELPSVGTKLIVNGVGWSFRKGKSKVRVLSPVEGEVISVSVGTDDCYLRVKPAGECDLRHLLSGAEIRPWMMRELERLQMVLSTGRVGFSLADGGELVHDMPSNYPDADWDSVLGEMFLEP